MRSSLLSRALSVAVAGLLPFAHSAHAQAPAAAPVRGPSVEGITEYRFSNGLRVLLFPDKSKPQTTVNVTYLVGSRQEGFGETGMAHLLEHMLFKGSTKHRKTSDEISAHGAAFDATTSFDRTNYFETFTAADSNLVWALDLEADRMINSFIAREDLDKEFSVVRNEYESGENNPFLVTFKRVLGSAYLFHSYGRLPIGSQSDIENVPINRLQAFYKKYYQPDNAVVTIVGNFDETRALALVQEKFGTIPRPNRILEQTYTVEPTQDGERNAIVRRAGDQQIIMAYYHLPAGSHPDFPAIDVLTNVLGDRSSGRLFKSVVETKLAASAQAQNLQQHDPAGLFVAAQLRKDQSIDSAQTAMLAAVAAVATTQPPTAAEVDRAKATILKNFELAPSNTRGFGLQLSEWMAMGDWRLFFYHRDQVKKVTPQDVQRVAAAYLKSSNRTIGQFIPTDKADRSEIAAAPSVEALLKDYKSEAVVATGEAFDPSPANIESRVHRSTLPSGLQVALLSKKNRGEAVTAVLNLRVGNEQSLMNRGTAASFAAQMLMRGTKTLNRQQISDSLNQLKARVAVSAPAPFNVRVAVETTRPNLDAVLRLVGQIVREPALDAKEFDQLQRESLAQVESQRGEPNMVGQTMFMRQVTAYPKGHPRYVPTIDEQIELVKAATLADVKRFHSDFYGAAHGELVVVGDFDEPAIAKTAAANFGNWKNNQPFKPVPMKFAATTAGKNTAETPDKPNAFFMAGQTFTLKDTDPDYAALLLVNYLLGESPLDSKLGARIRVKEGLSYAVQSAINVGSLDPASQWIALAIYNPVNADKVYAAFFDEMGKVLKDGFSAEEVEKAKSAFVQRRTLVRSSDATLALQLSTALYLGRTMTFDADVEKKIATLTPDAVNAALRKTLDPAKMAVVMTGDFAKVKQAGTPR